MAGPYAICFSYPIELRFRLARQRISQGPAKLTCAALLEPPVLQAHELLPSHAVYAPECASRSTSPTTAIIMGDHLQGIVRTPFPKGCYRFVSRASGRRSCSV